MKLFAGDLLTALEFPDAFPALVRRCHVTIDRVGADAAGDMLDALAHATAVVFEGDARFTRVVRAVASISERLEPEFVSHDAYAVAV